MDVIHGIEWEEEPDPRLYKTQSRTFAKRWRETSVSLRESESQRIISRWTNKQHICVRGPLDGTADNKCWPLQCLKAGGKKA